MTHFIKLDFNDLLVVIRVDQILAFERCAGNTETLIYTKDKNFYVKQTVEEILDLMKEIDK